MAEVTPEAVPGLVELLKHDFYLEPDMMLEAIQTRSSFNMLYLQTMLKVDVFLPATDAWAEEKWTRRLRQEIGTEADPLPVFVASPEDMILQKLVRFRLGGGVSERQWSDVVGMAQVQAPALDVAYLLRWAATLELTELLERALEEAALTDIPNTEHEA